MDFQLVGTDWLTANLDSPGMVILDCSWYLPESGKKGRDDFVQAHVPGARYLDLELISDADSPYVNMLPAAELFAAEVSRLGIDNDTLVIVYDAGYVSARIWWMFKAFGHDRVRILDGGLRKWKAEGRALASGMEAPFPAGKFAATPHAGMVASWRDALTATQDSSINLVDARTAERFTGAMSSGYPGVAGGHMPGAINTPWSQFMDPAAGHVFVSPAVAEEIFVRAGVDLDKPVVATCGSGVTAAILGLMLERTGRTNYRIYDGSWHEWGQREDLPKVSVPNDTEAGTAPGKS